MTTDTTTTTAIRDRAGDLRRNLDALDRLLAQPAPGLIQARLLVELDRCAVRLDKRVRELEDTTTNRTSEGQQ